MEMEVVVETMMVISIFCGLSQYSFVVPVVDIAAIQDRQVVVEEAVEVVW